MAIGSNINFKDPRFQEALLRSGSDPRSTGIAARQGITGDFTANQMGQLVAFHNLDTNRRAFRNSMKLAKSRSAFQNRYFKQSLHDARQEARLTRGLGIVGAGMSFLEGRRRAELTRQDAAWKRAFNERLIRHMEEK